MADTGNGGYIRLHRQILKWEWYGNTNTFRLFLHCLLKANFTDGKFEGRDIKRGSFVTSLDKLSKEIGQSVKQVRVSLDHLIRTGEVASQSFNRYRIITVVKYDGYQSDGKQNGNQRASKGQAEGKQTASKGQQYKKDNKDNNDKKEKNIFSPPSVDEVREYCESRNNGIDPETFVDFYESKGWMIGKNRMKDWKAAVRTWERDRKKGTAKQNATDVHGYGQRDYSGEQKKALERMMNDEEW